MVIKQAQLFLIFLLNGISIGLLFDFFRILRKSFNTKDFMTYIEDVCFWLLTGLLILYFIFIFNNGEIRIYMFVSIILGFTIYILTLSKYIVKISVNIILFLKNIIIKIISIIIFPFKYLYKFICKIFFKPISFIFINIRKNFTNCYKNINLLMKKNKKVKNNSKKIEI